MGIYLIILYKKTRYLTGVINLGGQDIDKIIVEYFLSNFNNFPKNNTKMMKRLLEACTEAKIMLSSYETTTIHVHILVEFH